MAIVSLGKVAITAAGTPEPATKNQPTPTKRFIVHSFVVEALPSNTGKVYIGINALNKSTLAGVYAILPIPTTSIIPSFSATLGHAYDAFDMSLIGIDVEVSGEGVLISVVRQ